MAKFNLRGLGDVPEWPPPSKKISLLAASGHGSEGTGYTQMQNHKVPNPKASFHTRRTLDPRASWVQRLVSRR